MRKRKIWLNIIFALILVICFGAISTAFQPDNGNNFIIAATSLGVALLALYISLRTFYSIDEVNAISRMDGNVMENPRYRPNILRAVFLFPQVGFAETSKAYMTYLNDLFQKKDQQSGAHLADSVQETADLLVLVPYFIKTYDQNESAVQLNSVSRLLTRIKTKVDDFKEISDGSCKLLEETVRLIESVVAYQSWDVSNRSNPTKLLELRGSIFINPVTCILYHDYLGLYFLRRARAVMCKQIESPTLREMIEYAKKCADDEKSMALVYLNKASESFKRAKENVGDDMIWTGYICFNIARVEYLKKIINESYGETVDNVWEEYINESIRSWITSNRMIAEHITPNPDSNASWLQKAFVSEENSVRLSKVLMQMMSNQPLTDYNGNAWVSDYNEIADTSFYKSIPPKDPQKLTDSLKEDICKLLKNN
jgi:hypothetical protein